VTTSNDVLLCCYGSLCSYRRYRPKLTLLNCAGIARSFKRQTRWSESWPCYLHTVATLCSIDDRRPASRPVPKQRVFRSHGVPTFIIGKYVCCSPTVGQAILTDFKHIAAAHTIFPSEPILFLPGPHGQLPHSDQCLNVSQFYSSSEKVSASDACLSALIESCSPLFWLGSSFTTRLISLSFQVWDHKCASYSKAVIMASNCLTFAQWPTCDVYVLGQEQRNYRTHAPTRNSSWPQIQWSRIVPSSQPSMSHAT